jgi:rhodanese-related sulfurtransferase
VRRAGRLWCVTLLAVLLLAACGRPETRVTWTEVQARIDEAFPHVPSIETAALSELMQGRTPSLVLLDVREPEEFAVSHLKGAVRVTSPDLAADLASGAPEGAIIIAYCSVGYRSARLTAALRDRGLTNVRNLEGSIFRWANEDRPLFRGDRPVRHVHPFDENWGVLLNADRRAYRP